MNFFKSILSDEDPPQPETTTSPSPAPRAGAYTSQTQQPTDLPAPRAAAPGAWSFGDLVKTITTRSESVLETYRRDLAEFGSGLRKESDLFREVANNAVKDLPASIDGVMKVIVPEPELSKNSKSESVRNYSRFDSQLSLLQNDVRTYVDDPEDDLGEFGKWKLGFVLGEKRGEIAEENVVRGNDKKPSLDNERENVSSTVVDDENERKLSGGDVSHKDIVDEVKPSGDEKVELVTKTEENAGVGSVCDKEKEKLQVDEDLEWDEIGDIGENDEKSVLSQGGSLKKDEVLKRLNSGDDDEDLSWDIEDDDEPLNAGKSK
ncbi:BSD domain-containing protein [Artemisia annua]|uniref:BSD domain-containing protein n=1 Tax=Artemisia annua TaxID=35608 RepID=A0A2U1Q230_ARTAN|nr:BSD domain-containing protein [Artemisia annua]